MSRTAVAVLASLAVLAALPRATLAADPKRSADEKTLFQLETEWSAAVKANDLATLEKILAADWAALGPFGPFTRAEMLADFKSGAQKVESITPPRDMKVRFFGDVAVVTGTHDEKSSYQGKDTSGRWVWTDVWVKRKGKWQAVASHNSLAASK